MRAWALHSLAQIDSTYFTKGLELARLVQDEFKRAVLEFLYALIQTDPAYLTEAFEALWLLIQTERKYVEFGDIFCDGGVAKQLPEALLPALLEILSLFQNEQARAEGLCGLAEELPEVFLPQALDAIHAIIHKLTRATTLRSYLPRLSLATLPYPDWQSHLHLLAHCTRADLMQDLATLHPPIAHLGGAAAIRGMVDAMRDVCNQWK